MIFVELFHWNIWKPDSLVTVWSASSGHPKFPFQVSSDVNMPKYWNARGYDHVCWSWFFLQMRISTRSPVKPRVACGTRPALTSSATYRPARPLTAIRWWSISQHPTTLVRSTHSSTSGAGRGREHIRRLASGTAADEGSVALRRRLPVGRLSSRLPHGHHLSIHGIRLECQVQVGKNSGFFSSNCWTNTSHFCHLIHYLSWWAKLRKSMWSIIKILIEIELVWWGLKFGSYQSIPNGSLDWFFSNEQKRITWDGEYVEWFTLTLAPLRGRTPRLGTIAVGFSSLLSKTNIFHQRTKVRYPIHERIASRNRTGSGSRGREKKRTPATFRTAGAWSIERRQDNRKRSTETQPLVWRYLRRSSTRSGPTSRARGRPFHWRCRRPTRAAIRPTRSASLIRLPAPRSTSRSSENPRQSYCRPSTVLAFSLMEINPLVVDFSFKRAHSLCFFF